MLRNIEETAEAGVPPPSTPALQRARGHVRLMVRAGPAGSAVETRFEQGSGRVRIVAGSYPGEIEAVLINTAGGMTGGDRFLTEVAVGDEGRAVVTTQAAERIYRRTLGAAKIESRIIVGDGARLDWLPQETIVFDRSAMRRSLEADCAPTAEFLAVEATVLGRAAMGERLRQGEIRETWRVRRGGRLLFADGTRLDGDADALLKRGATGGGAAAYATLLLLAPDAGGRLAAARDALAGIEGEAGASAWNGILLARLLAPSGMALRTGLVRLIEALRGKPMPRLWNC